MPVPSAAEKILTLLPSARDGDRRAASSLLPLVYEELLGVARARMAREQPGQTLQATALLNEAWLRVVGDHDPGWENARHFFAAASEAMRRILIERARRKSRLKHGCEFERVDIDVVEPDIDVPHTDVLDLHAAIEKLERDDPRKAQIAVLRCFGGLGPEDTARTMGVSLSTIEREWRFTKAWLKQEMKGGEAE